MIDKFISFLSNNLSDYDWKKAKCVLIFSEQSLNRNIYYLLSEEFIRLDVKPKEYKFFTNYNRELYLENLNDKSKRFNKLELIIFPDGHYKENYFWDEKKEIADKLMAAEFFYQWTNDTLMNRIFEYEKDNELLKPNYDENGDLIDYQESWDRGLFLFIINNNIISHKITLYKNSIERDLPMPLPPYFIKGLLEHQLVTNTELTNEWKPWNRLLINSPHNSIPYDKWQEYVEYSLEVIEE
ncbi:hypothetical protein [Aureibaculum luteum]|uniref:hypothetical protein n=1 Tax=Aureibaculum luteum TaxID=1548456 RepID=UPI000E4C7157|nr:hypothetical protein [Aureibaculum luteum]